MIYLALAVAGIPTIICGLIVAADIHSTKKRRGGHL